MTKAIFVIGIVLLVLPGVSLADVWEEEWEGNSWYPICNFSFEEFDEASDQFTDWDFEGTGGEINQSTGHSLHYSRSAYILVASQKDAYLEQSLDDDPGIYFDDQPCYLIAYVRTEEVSSTSGGGVLAKVITDSGETEKEYESNIITGDRNWIKLIVPFDLIELGENDEVTIQIGLFSAKGKVWIDFVQLLPRDCLAEQTLNEIPQLRNISFEEYSNNVFEDWGSSIGDNCTRTQNANVFVLGSNSVEFNFSTPPDSIRTSSIFQSINVPQDFRTYCFSAYIRTDDLDISGIPGGLGAYYQINYPNLTWASKSFSGDNGWVRVEGVIEKPRDTGLHDPIQVKAIVSAKEGKTWFDWVNLRLNLVQNVEFNDWGTEESSLVVWKCLGFGPGGLYTDGGHESDSCGWIFHGGSTYKSTHLLQELGVGDGVDEICLHEGGTYLLSGWIKTENVEPYQDPTEPGAAPSGAYVELVFLVVDPFLPSVVFARTECFTGTSDGWQEFSIIFSVPFNWFKGPYYDDEVGMFDANYKLRCHLKDSTGTVYFDDINIAELEFSEDVATVIPQPKAFEYRGYSSAPQARFEPTNGGTYITTIYYTPENPPVSVLGDTYLFSAENLRKELNRAFYECMEGDDPASEYPIDSDSVIPLNENVSSLSLPCIILGDPELDDSDGELFKAEMEKRGMIIPEDLNPEGYIMDISEDFILIAASDSSGEGLLEGAGSFYATQTLLQLLDIVERSDEEVEEGDYTYHPNMVVAPAGYIYDYPDLPWRGQNYCDIPFDHDTGDEPGEILEYLFDEHRSDGDEYFDQNLRDLEFFSALKVNRVYIGNGIYYYQDAPDMDGYTAQHYNYEDYWEKMVELFNFCRRRHMEPIPFLQSGGHSYNILYWRPEFAECMWIGETDESPPGADEPYPRPREMRQFNGEGIFLLDEYNVIDAPGAEIKLYYSQTGDDEITREGNWYPTFSSEPFCGMTEGFDPFGGEVTIHISEGSELEPQDTVYVSYNAIWSLQSNSLKLAYCTAADGLYEFMEDVIDKTIDELNPKYILFGHDEVLQYHTDERDRDEDFEDDLLGSIAIDMPARLLATDLDKLIDIVKDRLDPPQVIVYGDMLNQEHRGEFFCSTDVNDAPGHLKGKARPCDMGGVDQWFLGGPKGKTWPGCQLLESAGHGDIIINDWTGATYIYGYSAEGPLYAKSLIQDIIDCQSETGYTTLGLGYSHKAGLATANLVVNYMDPIGAHTREVLFNPLIAGNYSWEKYTTSEIDLTDATSITSAFVTARMSDYLFGSVWFDDLSVHEEGGPNKLGNPGFETAGGGDGDTFAIWEEIRNPLNPPGVDFILRDEVVKFSGNSSCLLFRPKYPRPKYRNNYVKQNVSLSIGKTYVLEGYMRADEIESFVFENCYNWTHEIFKMYADRYDCPGVVYWEGYSWGYPGIIQDWLWSIDWPVTWWEHASGMAYLKIGNLGNTPYSGISSGEGYYPLEHLYPIERGKKEEELFY